MTDATQRKGRQPQILTALEQNRERRRKAELEVERAREELTRLLVRGARLPLAVAVMARAAGISRETAHKLLRRKRKES